ncbi:sugar ABC transporter ATP-binding protein [Streptomyces sp. NPDC002917]|uniref:sugar ABC transporter ATP-binding protein n=1 Tax=Streptomyces sp. NPDC002917 TaxID=3364671 RepID=UPI0036AC8927
MNGWHPSSSASMAPSPALDVRNVTKTFAGNRALDSVSLQIAPGEIHALLGENGSGKSTLIKVLSGYHRPDAGELRIGGRSLDFGSPHSGHLLGARFVHQDLGLVEDCSIADNLAYGSGFPTAVGTIREGTLRERARKSLEGMELDLDPRVHVSRLSPAQKTGVAVARALLPDEQAPARLLVLDEPTARLPEEEVEQLLSVVRLVAARGVGVLYVTHRLDEVFDIGVRATVLRDGRRVVSRPIAGMDRDGLLRYLFGDKLQAAHRRSTRLRENEAPVLSVENLQSEVLRGISFQVAPGEVVGVAGVAGSGREAVCSTVFGARVRDGGCVRILGEALPENRPDVAISRGLAYIPAERKLEGCFADLSARENITVSNMREVWRFPFLRRLNEKLLARRWFEQIGIRPVSAIDRPMSTFSGGNQQKIIYAKWFQTKPVLFLLDEPTQGVDVAAKGELQKTLLEAAERDSAVLVSSSDLDELTTICDRVLVLASGSIVANLVGEEITVPAMTRAALGIQPADEDGIEE